MYLNLPGGALLQSSRREILKRGAGHVNVSARKRGSSKNKKVTSELKLNRSEKAGGMSN